MKRKFCTLFLVLVMCISIFSVTASAQANEGAENTPLTPDGNMTLVDDILTSNGKQFITITTKDGNYFYIVIDRADDSNQSVHFLNQVDEVDLLKLLDDDAVKEYENAHKPTEPAPTQPVTVPTPTEPQPVKKDSNSSPLALAGMADLGLLGVGFFVMSQKNKQSNRPKPDPDADYQEDEEYELLEDAESISDTE